MTIALIRLSGHGLIFHAVKYRTGIACLIGNSRHMLYYCGGFCDTFSWLQNRRSRPYNPKQATPDFNVHSKRIIKIRQGIQH